MRDKYLDGMGGNIGNYTLEEIEEAQRMKKKNGGTLMENLAKHGRGTHKNLIDESRPYDWYGESVKAILSHPEYMGHTVNFRTSKKSYKDKRVKNDPEDWLIFENTFSGLSPLKSRNKGRMTKNWMTKYQHHHSTGHGWMTFHTTTPAKARTKPYTKL